MRRSVFSFLLLALLPAVSASALGVTHVFGGVVTVVDPSSNVADASSVGERFQFTVTYDTGIRRTDDFFPPTGDLVASRYRAETRLVSPIPITPRMFEFIEPPTTYEFLLAGQTIDSFTPPTEPFTFPSVASKLSEIQVANDFPAGPGTPANDGFSFRHVVLLDTSQSVFSDTSLPLMLQLADFDIAELRFEEQVGFTRRTTIRGIVDTVTSTTVVPEPTAALLLGLGLVGLCRKKSNAT